MQQPPRVLIVDDAPKTARMLCMMLTSAADCTAAESGAEALRLYEQARQIGSAFQLIILDLAMPIMSGLEVAKRIREGGDEETAIVFLTAYPDPELPSSAHMVNVAGVWKKPITADVLRQNVLNVLRGERRAAARE